MSVSDRAILDYIAAHPGAGREEIRRHAARATEDPGELLGDEDRAHGVGKLLDAGAFGADGILLSPGCADPLYRKAIRVSIGASLSVPFARLADWPGDLTVLSARGYTILALTPEPGAIDIVEFGAARPVPERLALLFGAEGAGLSAAARAAADNAVKIAMTPGADSLNIATACGIALHRLVHRASSAL